MIEHTKTPWLISDAPADGFRNPVSIVSKEFYGVIANTGNWHDFATQKANAQYICNAVNSHDALVSALETLMQAEGMQTQGKRDGGTMAIISNAIDQARDALKLAKEE